MSTEEMNRLIKSSFLPLNSCGTLTVVCMQLRQSSLQQLGSVTLISCERFPTCSMSLCRAVTFQL